MLRSASAVLAALLVLLVAPVASATELTPPPPLGSGEADLPDGMTLVRSWTMQPTLDRDDTSDRRYPTLAPPDAARVPPALVTVIEGVPQLHLRGAFAAGVAPVPLPVDVAGGSGGPFDLTLDTGNTGAADAQAVAVPTDAALAGGTRFDVRPAISNPIDVGGDVVDDLVAAVVRTPEPGTLALFGLGAAALLWLVARRRRLASA